MAELREYKIVHVENSGRCMPDRPGGVRDFNDLITDGWEIDRVLVWNPATKGETGGYLLFSRPRAADYQPPHHATSGAPATAGARPTPPGLPQT